MKSIKFNEDGYTIKDIEVPKQQKKRRSKQQTNTIIEEKIEYNQNGEPIYTIYLIYCKDENVKDSYIGSTKNFQSRIDNHSCSARNKYTTPVYVIINKNGGIDNWLFKKLEEIEYRRTDNILKEEQVYIDLYEPTMNIKNAWPKQNLRIPKPRKPPYVNEWCEYIKKKYENKETCLVEDIHKV